jgi:hypothetical protein
MLPMHSCSEMAISSMVCLAMNVGTPVRFVSVRVLKFERLCWMCTYGLPRETTLG